MGSTGQAKTAIRQRVWSRLEAVGAVEPGAAGYIPDFTGASQAAERLAALPAWKTAAVIKTAPDTARLLSFTAVTLIWAASMFSGGS